MVSISVAGTYHSRLRAGPGTGPPGDWEELKLGEAHPAGSGEAEVSHNGLQLTPNAL